MSRNLEARVSMPMHGLADRRSRHASLCVLVVAGALIGSMTACGGSGAGGGAKAPIDDPDSDGLSTEEELAFGTDPLDPDSDDDYLDDGGEKRYSTDPLDPDSDADLLLDGFEIDAGTHARVPDAISWLGGAVTLANQDPAGGAEVRIDAPVLQKSYAGLTAIVDAGGRFSFAWPWPTALTNEVSIAAESNVDGALHSGSLPLPPLAAGNVELPLLALQFQPYTRGTDFFIALPNLEAFLEEQVVILALLNPGDRSVTANWSIPGVPPSVPGASGKVDLAARSAGVASLPGRELIVEHSANNQIVANARGIRVTSNRPISVALHSYSDDAENGSAAFAALPTSSYGTTYFLQSLGVGVCSRERGALAIMTAGHEDVELSMTFTAALDLIENGVPRHLPIGITADVALPYEHSWEAVAQMQTLTGSFVTGDRPFGVLGGTTCMDGAEIGGFTQGSVATQFLSPTHQWGREFTTFGGIGNLDSQVYLVAGAEGAEVAIGSAPPITLLPGGEYSFVLTQNSATMIASDRPILAWQLFGWYDKGAPAIHLAPNNRWTTEEMLWSFAAPFVESSIAAIFPSGSDLRVDGVPADQLPGVSITSVNSTYKIMIAPTVTGSHRVSCDAPMFPLVFGKPDDGNGRFDWYAYAYSTTW